MQKQDTISKSDSFSSPDQTRKKTRKITNTLECLFQKVDFINGAKDNDKICFKDRYYVSKNSWIGAFLRANKNETYSDLIDRIKNVSKQLVEQYDICQDYNIATLILQKIVALRDTCVRLRDTTYSGKTPVYVLFNTVISSIDIGLPGGILKVNGIASPGGGFDSISPNKSFNNFNNLENILKLDPLSLDDNLSDEEKGEEVSTIEDLIMQSENKSSSKKNKKNKKK